VNTEDQLKTLVQVALTYPMSLQELREVHHKGFFSDKLCYGDDILEMWDFLNMCMEVN
jgi:hypothetical protein